MTASPELLHELRASRPVAPASSSGRGCASSRPRERRSERSLRRGSAPRRRSRSSPFRLPQRSCCRRAGLVGSCGLDASRRRAGGSVRRRRDGSGDRAVAGHGDGGPTAAAEPPRGDADLGPTVGSGGARAEPEPRAARRGDAHGRGRRLRRRLAGVAGRARPHPLARRSRRQRRPSRRATGASASLTVRVPVAKVQQAIAGLSALGKITSQQVTIDDLQESLDSLTQSSGVGAQPDRRDHGTAGRRETLDAETRAALEARRRTLRSELRRAPPEHRRRRTRSARFATMQLTVVTPGRSGSSRCPRASTARSTVR